MVNTHKQSLLLRFWSSVTHLRTPAAGVSHHTRGRTRSFCSSEPNPTGMQAVNWQIKPWGFGRGFQRLVLAGRALWEIPHLQHTERWKGPWPQVNYKQSYTSAAFYVSPFKLHNCFKRPLSCMLGSNLGHYAQIVNQCLNHVILSMCFHIIISLVKTALPQRALLAITQTPLASLFQRGGSSLTVFNAGSPQISKKALKARTLVCTASTPPLMALSYGSSTNSLH